MSLIIALIASISFNLVFIWSNIKLFKAKKEAENKYNSAQKQFLKMKAKAKKQDEKNQERLENLAQEVARVKGMTIDEVWRKF